MQSNKITVGVIGGEKNMKVTITSYVTAVDDKPEHGNHLRYSVEVHNSGETFSNPNLSELDVIELLAQTMKTDFVHFRTGKTDDSKKDSA